MEAGLGQYQGCLDHSGRYLFCPDEDRSLNVYDTQCDSVAAVYVNLPSPATVLPNPEQRSIYAMCQDVILVYPDAPPGVCEQPSLSAWPEAPPQTVVRGVLVLDAVDCKQHSAYRVELLDIAGRRVMDLKPGANDVRALAPGVYFIREQPQAVRKAVIAK